MRVAANAAECLDRLLKDAELHGVEVVATSPVASGAEFLLALEGRTAVVSLPDADERELRWLPGDRVRDRFVQIEGLDWYWPFAVEVVYALLTGRHDDAPATLEAMYAGMHEFNSSSRGWRLASRALVRA